MKKGLILIFSVFLVTMYCASQNSLVMVSGNDRMSIANDKDICENYPDPLKSEYMLPFMNGYTYILQQGNCERFSHKGSIRYAYDFAMPMGTSVIAARAGYVVTVDMSHPDYIIKNGRVLKKSRGAKGNTIQIKHNDGTVAMYYHLKQNGALVKPGDYVEQGQEIAKSGNSGYTSGPHLHFEVRGSERGDETMPVTFRNTSPLHKGPLITGEQYTAIDKSDTGNKNSGIAVYIKRGLHYLKSLSFSDFFSSSSTTSLR